MTTDPPHSGLPPGIVTSASSGAPSSILWRGLLACSTRRSAPLFFSRSGSPCFASKPLSFYGSPHEVAPLGPGAVVVTHALVTKEVLQDEPRVGGALSYPAIGYYVVSLAETKLSLVLTGTPHVDHPTLGLQVPLHVLPERPDPGVVPLRNGVVSPWERWHILGHLAPLSLPLYPSTVHDLHVVMAEEPEHPEGVGRPPVVLVPVEDNRRVRVDAHLCHEIGEVLRVEVITHQRIVQVLDPVYLHGVRDMAYVVEEHVLVRFDYAYVLRVVEVLCDPLGADEGVRVRVALLLYLLFRHRSSSIGLRGTSAHSSVSPIEYVEFMFGKGPGT